ncbi:MULTISPECIES: hypothetical protein [unclassified Pseudomonas]|uniref:hypothetical protein n=1 Tax=unclassified Pseudomonas TaxID=196821 RepID=UPI000BD5F57A|nr:MULTISPECIES: hypothetical protein [unclassified Pseudomonas]PVZ19937.1 hypothetical protein F474_00528 [Pseudomonas sp. URIL14HWK12:I12]PVZ27003.1 hypothetical protein F470_00183 [Pseudomonas sp. URIL14HWK12:I10]PVZ37892.1 hypothetical protein F472_00528 [Pseudomonas sp. URIL14HWK12:I11]SNZ05250.1 hypothetical protein SAMN05660463_00876 [Pseudomonas sp. URIL14HWK12:I9]
MRRILEVRKVPKVIIQAARFGEKIQPTPAAAEWYMVYDAETGEQHEGYDDEQEAIAYCEKYSSPD